MKQPGLCAAHGTAVPLRGVDVTGELLGAHARVAVRQRYLHTEAAPIEAVYTFPLPVGAALVGFSMTVAGRRIDAVVREREAAFRAYDAAVVAGHGAALLEKQRDDVFTATVGNLLPGEAVEVELVYLQRLRADEGALRWVIPTLVAPRYIPGQPQGDRRGHGTADPTDRVPDADLVTPPVAAVDYRLTLDLALDLGCALRVESPSHALTVEHDGTRARVRLAGAALDRDVVVIARDVREVPLAGAVAHRGSDGRGYFALGVTPDLFDARRAAPLDVVFVLDRSGSMGGASITEARSALRLCLRQLREGDRFAVVAFNERESWFARGLAPFTQASLEGADRWVATLEASGGTEVLRPLVHAVTMAPDGVVVLLTDGQVGNEAEVVAAVLEARRTTRVFSLGIGTNVSEGLPRELARRTHGEVECIHPGERVDDKVVAVFARAVAARVTGVRVAFEGVTASELAPAEAPDLVDGEPWSLLGRYDAPGDGLARITGTRGGEPFALEVPLGLPAEAARPALAKLWAAERVRDLEGATITDPRRTAAMRERIVALAVEHGVASRHTSFVLVEEREGARVGVAAPETRVVPVSAPARSSLPPAGSPGIARWDPVSRSVVYESGRPSAPTGGPSPKKRSYFAEAKARTAAGRAAPVARMRSVAAPPAARDVEAWKALLEAQLAGGLWGAAGADDAARMRDTAEALVTLVRQGVTSTHPLYGPQMRKAVEALIALVAAGVGSPALAAWALAVCALVSDGARTAKAIGRVAAARGGLAGFTGATVDHAALRRELDALGQAARAAP